MAAASRRWAGRVTLRSSRAWGTVSAGAFSPQPAPQPDQEVVGQQGHGGVVVPAAPAAHLVVIQAQVVFALANDDLHGPRWTTSQLRVAQEVAGGALHS